MHMTDATQTVSTNKTTALMTHNPSAEPTSAAYGCDTPMNTLCGTRNCVFTPLWTMSIQRVGWCSVRAALR